MTTQTPCYRSCWLGRNSVKNFEGFSQIVKEQSDKKGIWVCLQWSKISWHCPFNSTFCSSVQSLLMLQGLGIIEYSCLHLWNDMICCRRYISRRVHAEPLCVKTFLGEDLHVKMFCVEMFCYRGISWQQKRFVWRNSYVEPLHEETFGEGRFSAGTFQLETFCVEIYFLAGKLFKLGDFLSST